MKFVVMVDRANGNASVGEMWTETKTFDETATLADVGDWLAQKLLGLARSEKGEKLPCLGNVRLQIDESSLP